MTTLTQKRFINSDEMAEILGCTRRSIANFVTTGRIPKPVPFGRLKRWSAEDIDAWIAAGSPTAVEWEADKQGQ